MKVNNVWPLSGNTKTPNFAFSTTQNNKCTLVLVCLQCLNLVYYDKSALVILTSSMWKWISIFPNVAWDKLTRVCMKVDLTKLIIGKV